MPRIKKPKKVKEPIRLRMKDLSDGSKSLYLDIYRNGKRTYEYLKLYLIPGTDSNTRRQNEITMAAANAIKSKRIIELTSGEAGIVNHTDKIYLLDWMQTYLEYQEKRDKKGIGQIKAVTHILKEYAGERFILDRWKSHATLTLLATQDLPTFGYNMIDPLKSWCWGSILFYPFKISRFS